MTSSAPGRARRGRAARGGPCRCRRARRSGCRAATRRRAAWRRAASRGGRGASRRRRRRRRTRRRRRPAAPTAGRRRRAARGARRRSRSCARRRRRGGRSPSAASRRAARRGRARRARSAARAARRPRSSSPSAVKKSTSPESLASCTATTAALPAASENHSRGVDDLARLGDVREAPELDPLDVADDGEAGHARSFASRELAHAGLEVLDARGSRARVAARSGEAKTWRTSPARHSPVTSGGSAGSTARASAAAMSPTLRGVPLATLNAPGVAGVERQHVGARRRRARGRSRAAARRPRTPAAARPAASEERKMLATPGVGRVARHPRAVDVVVAQRGDGRARLARERGAQVLLGELGRGVDVARVERRVLGHRLGLERAAADRARRLEAAGVEVLGARAGRAGRSRAPGSGSGPRRRRPCSRRARAAGEAARGERAQQHRGAEVVVGDVVGDVAEVDAEADHRRLVADRGHAVDGARATTSGSRTSPSTKSARGSR